MNKALSFVAGALCGAAVGGVAALLLAPLSGKTLRARWRDSWEQLAAEVRQSAIDKRRELEMQLAALKVKHNVMPTTEE